VARPTGGTPPRRLSRDRRILRARRSCAFTFPIGDDGSATRDTTVFSPRAAIAAGSQPHAIAAAEASVRARLRELPMIYILLVVMATFYRVAVLRDDDLVLYYLDVTIVALLGGVIALLSSRRPVSLARLRALELGMTGMLAGRVATVQYRLILESSVRHDPLLAQLTTKNIVLLTAILIFTYALYVPKSWRRAAVVVGPLALLPFATLLLLYLRHPEAMGWLGLVSSHCELPRVWLFSFDLMALIILAVGSALGAHMISRLRREAAEARQVGQYRLRRNRSRLGTRRRTPPRRSWQGCYRSYRPPGSLPEATVNPRYLADPAFGGSTRRKYS
jgi:serine/threonine-protein kinase